LARKEIPALDHLLANPRIWFLFPIQLQKTAERIVIVSSKQGLGTGAEHGKDAERSLGLM